MFVYIHELFKTNSKKILKILYEDETNLPKLLLLYLSSACTPLAIVDESNPLLLQKYLF